MPGAGQAPAKRVAPPTDTATVDASSSGSSLLGPRNLLFAALVLALLGGVLVARRRRTDCTDELRDPSAAAQDAAIHAAAQAADAAAMAAGLIDEKPARRFSLRRRSQAAPESLEMPPAIAAPTAPSVAEEPTENVVAMPGHEQWTQPAATSVPATAPAPPAPMTTTSDDAVSPTAPSDQSIAPPAPATPAPPATDAPPAASPQPAPLTLQGVVPRGHESPGQWVELEHTGNVVFQLTGTDTAPLEILFADAEGTWFQVPPMDPATGAVALPLDAGRYYVQLRDPSQTDASYHLVIWPAVAPVAASPVEPQAVPAAFDPQQLAA